MNRRTFLISAGAGLAGVAAIAVGVTITRPDDDETGSTVNDESVDTMTATATQGAIDTIGAAYLAAVPEENDVATLLRQTPEMEGVAGPEDLQILQGLVAGDFEAGEVVSLDGWVLSRTEARGAAYLSLT